MAIQTRRGLEADFDPSKMLPGEWAVSLDTKYVRMCFSPGVVMRMATYESFEEDMLQIQQILVTCEDIQVAVEAFEVLAQQHANAAEASATASANSAIDSDNSALFSQSWAEGGTGTRPGEDTDNARYWSEVAQAVADIQIATNDTVGIVKGNEGEINIDIGGQMSIPSDFTPQTTLEAVTGTEDKKTFFGKVAKVITDFIAHAANLSIHFGLTNNLLATVPGTALDAVQGKALDTRVTTNTNDIDTLTRNLNYSKFNVPAENVLINEPHTIVPVTQTVVNADTSNYILNSNGILNIIKPGLYYINATIHGSIVPGDYVTAYIQTGISVFYGNASNPTTAGQQFIITFGGFVEISTAINVYLVVTSANNSVEVYGTNMSSLSSLAITRLK